jgi:5-methylcytosine-specific restriction endonuclease McrA
MVARRSILSKIAPTQWKAPRPALPVRADHNPQVQVKVARVLASQGARRRMSGPRTGASPALSLRFKVLQRDQFRCQLCGQSLPLWLVAH